MSNKTAVMKLYDMLDEGQISEIAEIKEYFLMLEQEQIEDAFSESRLTHPMIGFKHLSFNDYFNETYGGDK